MQVYFNIEKAKMPEFADIFKWKGWEDYGDTKAFMRCTLMKDIGGYKTGEYFESVFFNDEQLTLKFYKNDDELEDDTPCMIKHLGIID